MTTFLFGFAMGAAYTLACWAATDRSLRRAERKPAKAATPIRYTV